MKLSFKRTITPVICMLIVSLLAGPFNLCLGEDRVGRKASVSPEVLRYLEEEPFVPIIAVFREKADLEQALAAGRDRLESPGVVASELQKVNSSCERKIQFLLDEETARGNLRDYNPLWIINAFSAQVNSEGLRRLAESPQIGSIRLDRRLSYLSGFPENTSTAREQSRTAPEGALLSSFPGEGRDLFNLQAINVPPLWEEGYFGDGVVVAIMDTGVDPEHPALKHNYRGGLPGYSHNDSWFDATGSLSGSDGPRDTHGHGTHIAGIILAGTKESPLGIAPGASWIAVNIFSDGYAWDSHITQAFQWLLAPGGDPGLAPDIINCSWASRPEFAEDYLHWEILYNLEKAGILVFFAAGNNGEEGPGSPASYPHTFSAGALKQAGGRLEATGFSSRGPVRWQDVSYIKPELVAPGANIVSTWPGNNYAVQDGTSTAAAHLSGAAALLLEARPGLSPAEVKYLLKSTASWDPFWDKEGPRPNNVYGYGLLNAYAAVKGDSLLPAEPLFFDGAEEGIVNWKTSPENPWKITRELVGEGRFAFADSPWEEYENNTSSWLALAKPVSTCGYHSPVLSFQHFYDLQRGNEQDDRAYVEISVDGTNWTTVYRFSGSNGGLQPFTLPLNLPENTHTLYVRFRLQSNNNGPGRGWYIDDISLTASPLPLTALDRLRLSPERTRLGTGEEIAVEAGALFCSRLLRTIEPELVTWHSSNPAVALVENGVIKGLASGESIIRGAFHGRSAEFKVNVVEVGTPVSRPGPGTYINKVTVHLEAAPDLKTVYTLDGSEPDVTSTPYEGPIVISESGPLKARSYLGNIPGPVSEFYYTITEGARVYGSVELQGRTILKRDELIAVFISDEGEERYPLTSISREGVFGVDLPLGRYRLVLAKEQYLTEIREVELREQGELDLGVISLWAGDLNNDNRVDLADLALLSLAYNTRPGDINWNPLADLNGDGYVDISDLTMLTQNYGMAGESVGGIDFAP